jgi:hypothetical protein
MVAKVIIDARWCFRGVSAAKEVASEDTLGRHEKFLWGTASSGIEETSFECYCCGVHTVVCLYM